MRYFKDKPQSLQEWIQVIVPILIGVNILGSFVSANFDKDIPAIITGGAAFLLILVLAIPKSRFLFRRKFKNVVRIAIVRNGDAEYAFRAMIGFIDSVERLLSNSRYMPLIEHTCGLPNNDAECENEKIFEELFDRFNGRIDYLVTIGTTVSQFAYSRYKNKFPILFIAVTNPYYAGFPEDLEDRGNISGITYGASAKNRLEIIGKLFPNKQIGFVYDSKRDADEHFKEEILVALKDRKLSTVANRTHLIAINDDSIPKDAQENCDIFLGYYSVGTFMHDIKLSMKEGKVLIGTTRKDLLAKSAIAVFECDNRKNGQLAAEKIFGRSLLNNLALSKIPYIYSSSERLIITRNAINKFEADVSNVEHEVDYILENID